MNPLKIISPFILVHISTTSNMFFLWDMQFQLQMPNNLIFHCHHMEDFIRSSLASIHLMTWIFKSELKGLVLRCSMSSMLYLSKRRGRRGKFQRLKVVDLKCWTNLKCKLHYYYIYHNTRKKLKISDANFPMINPNDMLVLVANFQQKRDSNLTIGAYQTTIKYI